MGEGGLNRKFPKQVAKNMKIDFSTIAGSVRGMARRSLAKEDVCSPSVSLQVASESDHCIIKREHEMCMERIALHNPSDNLELGEGVSPSGHMTLSWLVTDASSYFELKQLFIRRLHGFFSPFLLKKHFIKKGRNPPNSCGGFYFSFSSVFEMPLG